MAKKGKPAKKAKARAAAPVKKSKVTAKPVKTVKPVPDGYHTITPHIILDDAAKAIEFYQKAFGAKDTQTLTRSVAWNGVALMIFACLPVMIGLAARTLHPDLARPEMALPTVLSQDVPPVVGALGLALALPAAFALARGGTGRGGPPGRLGRLLEPAIMLPERVATLYTHLVTEEDRAHLAVIQGAVKRMWNLIDALLAFSRAGRAAMRRAPIDVKLLVEEARAEYLLGALESRGWVTHR